MSTSPSFSSCTARACVHYLGCARSCVAHGLRCTDLSSKLFYARWYHPQFVCVTATLAQNVAVKQNHPLFGVLTAAVILYQHLGLSMLRIQHESEAVFTLCSATLQGCSPRANHRADAHTKQGGLCKVVASVTVGCYICLEPELCCRQLDLYFNATSPCQ